MPENSRQRDVIVIGSGPCGAIAATLLVEAGLRVTMLDAGTTAPRGVIARVGGNTIARWAEGGPDIDRHIAADDPHTEWFSSLSLGGLSNYWTAAVPRFHPDDFTEGAAIDERFRWPVTYEELEPFYGVVERKMSITGGPEQPRVPPNIIRFHRPPPPDWAALADRASGVGHSLGVLPMATGRPTMSAMRPTGWNSYHCLVKPLLSAGHLDLRRGARVMRLVWSATESVVTHVEFVDVTTGEVGRIGCGAVVLAAGTIDSTRILLSSRSTDFPDGLGNAGGLVGRYLHDHPRQWWPAQLQRPMRLLSHPMYIARNPHGESTEPLLASSLTLGMVERSTRTRIRSWYGGSSDLLGVQVFGTMVPEEEFTVALTDTDIMSDAPLRISIHYGDQARANMVAARDRFADVFEAGGMMGTPQPPYHDLSPGSSVHYGGTVRMHERRQFGVLDKWNRIHDAPNVVVSDLSCFPTGPEKNPTLTAMALAARAAHHLAGEIRSPSVDE